MSSSKKKKKGLKKVILWDKSLAIGVDEQRIYIDRRNIEKARVYTNVQLGRKKYREGERAELYAAMDFDRRETVKVGRIEILSFVNIDNDYTILKYIFKKIYRPKQR